MFCGLRINLIQISAGGFASGRKADIAGSRLAAIWRWASFECRRLGFRGTTRCSWDNSPRPGAGEKLSLLPAKVVEVGPCQTLDKLDIPRFSTLPGGQHIPACPHLVATAAPAA